MMLSPTEIRVYLLCVRFAVRALFIYPYPYPYFIQCSDICGEEFVLHCIAWMSEPRYLLAVDVLPWTVERLCQPEHLSI